MEYFIQTRGEEADYCWVAQTPTGGQYRATPPGLDSIDSAALSGTHFSLVLKWLSSSQVLLLVKNLPSNRQDFRERLIRNTLVCIAPFAEEKLVRGIMAAALEGQLEQALNQVIQPTQADATGFQVNFGELVSQLNSFEASATSPANLERYYARDSQSIRHKMAKELLNSSLPAYSTSNEFEPLVLLSRNLDAAYFENSQVWRGLSERVDDGEANPAPHNLPPFELPEDTPVPGKTPSPSTQFNITRNMIFLLVITIAAALIFLVGTFFNFGSR